MNYYNEWDKNAAAWLLELIAQGHILPADIARCPGRNWVAELLGADHDRECVDCRRRTSPPTDHPQQSYTMPGHVMQTPCPMRIAP